MIHDALKDVGFKNYEIINDDPPLCYADYIDFVISTSTSAFFDFLPEYHDKIKNLFSKINPSRVTEGLNVASKFNTKQGLLPQLLQQKQNK